MIQNISIEPIRKELSSNGGLLYFSNLSNHLNLEKRLNTISESSKLLTLVNGFITGADCLDDYDSLANEDFFSNIVTPYASTTLGKFLRKSFPPPTLKIDNTINEETKNEKIKQIKMETTTRALNNALRGAIS